MNRSQHQEIKGGSLELAAEGTIASGIEITGFPISWQPQKR